MKKGSRLTAYKSRSRLPVGCYPEVLFTFMERKNPSCRSSSVSPSSGFCSGCRV